MDKKILRLLIVDDSPDEAELVVAALRKAGYTLKNQRLQDLAGVKTALEKGQWDAVVTEFALPRFDAQVVLDLMKQAGLDIPFLVFTRKIQDADLMKIMRAGAHDVVLKEHPARLAPAVERELQVADLRRAHREALQKIKETESKHSAVIESSREAFCYCQDGMHMDANTAYLAMFGYASKEELTGIPVMNLIDKSDQPRFKEFIRKSVSQKTGESQEFLAVKQGGAKFQVEISAAPVTISGESCTQIVFNDVSKRKAFESRLQYLSQHDPLTGLYNRHHFLQELNKAVDRAKQGNGAAGVLYIDLNQIKKINNLCGHAAGDKFLLKSVRLLRDKLGEKTVLSRFSGDEFAALLHDVNEKQLKETAAALSKALRESTFIESGQTFKGDAAIGHALMDKSAENASKVLGQAHTICEQMKARATPAAPPAPAAAAAPAPSTPAAARAAVPEPPAAVVEKQPEPEAPAASPWRERLKKALEHDEFELAYEPVVNLHGDQAEYYEIQVRLADAGGKPVPAAEFMPEAIKTGQCADIDHWTVRAAVAALAALHQERRQASFFIGVQATAFKDAKFLPLVQQQLREAGVKPECLVFECDEAAVLAHGADAVAFAKAIKSSGCRFAVDNFGKDLDALKKFRDLPFDFLKIDGALAHNMARDSVIQASLKAILDVSKALGKKTVAKSVESAECLAVLWNLGVDYVQGGYFQPGDSGVNYGSGGEATLTSDAAPRWATTTNRRG